MSVSAHSYCTVGIVAGAGMYEMRVSVDDGADRAGAGSGMLFWKPFTAVPVAGRQAAGG